MSKKERLIEAGKTLLIVLLLISAVFLMRETNYYNSAFEAISNMISAGTEGSQTSGDTDSEVENHAVVLPMGISVSIGEGNRYASAYDSETVAADFQRFSAALGEALGSAGEPGKINRATWKRALERESVYIELYSPQMLSILSKQLGTEMNSSAGEAFSSKLCLSCVDDDILLLYSDKNGDYWSCDTALSQETLKGRLEEFLPNGASFSYESELLTGLDESTLILKALPEIHVVADNGSPSQQLMETLLFSTFGMNEYTASKYTESDGTAVYLDNSVILRVTPGGTAEVTSDSETVNELYADSFEDAINLCWDIALSTVGTASGAADIYISELLYGSDSGDYYFCFDYLLDGIPLELGERHAALFSFSSGRFEKAELLFKSYALSEQTLDILPMFQAAAIASSENRDEIKLVYSESGGGINCIWVDE